MLSLNALRVSEIARSNLVLQGLPTQPAPCQTVEEVQTLCVDFFENEIFLNTAPVISPFFLDVLQI